MLGRIGSSLRLVGTALTQKGCEGLANPAGRLPLLRLVRTKLTQKDAFLFVLCQTSPCHCHSRLALQGVVSRPMRGGPQRLEDDARSRLCTVVGGLARRRFLAEPIRVCAVRPGHPCEVSEVGADSCLGPGLAPCQCVV
jgi:hypothetical protein